ncbi:zinc ribbon domain-containing protein [Aerococcus viridans]|uniref:zinc ribbon domain-containing protein n=1 Tax=Aerococcus viridans TaxID=1377 RepID=UPI0039B09A6C
MICPNCQSTIPTDTKICPNCDYIFTHRDSDDDFHDTIEIPAASYVDTIYDKDDHFEAYKEHQTSAIQNAAYAGGNTDSYDNKDEKKAKKPLFSFGKINKKTKATDNGGPSRRQNKQDGNRLTSYAAYLLSYIKKPIQSPTTNELNKNPNHGITSLLLLAILNTVSITSLANYLVSHYEWFADLSVLPNLNFEFVAWRFGLKTFVFLIISLWLLPAMIHLFNRNNEPEKMSNNVWLTHFFGMNSISVIVAIVCFLSSLLAPLIFMIFVLLLTLMQVALLIITMTIHFLQSGNVNKSKAFYSILGVLLLFFLAVIFLVGLIY